MGRFDNLPLLIDVSHYQPNLDWAKLKAGGVKGVIAKAGESFGTDAMFAKHCQAAYDCDMPFGAYWFFDPTPYLNYGLPSNGGARWPKAEDDKQFQALINALKYKKYDFLVLDAERWWERYDEYLELLNGKRKKEDVVTLTDAWISQTAEVFAGWMKAYFKKPVWIYTGEWFVDSYAPSMNNWIKNYPLWVSSYPYDKGYVTCTWEQFRTSWMPPDTARIPTLSAPKATMWQFSGDKFILPGSGGSALDLNFYMGSEAQLWSEIGFIPRTKPAETPTETPIDPEAENPSETPATVDTSRMSKAIEAFCKAYLNI